MKQDNNTTLTPAQKNEDEKISVPKWLQNELHEKTEPYIDRMIEAYKKEGIGFSRFSLNTIALHSAVVGYYHAVPNPPAEHTPLLNEQEDKKEVSSVGYTGGEWKVINWGQIAQIRDSDHNEICVCGYGDRDNGIPDEETTANANRIVTCVNGYDILKAEMESWKKENFDNVEMASETIKKLKADNEALVIALESVVHYYYDETGGYLSNEKEQAYEQAKDLLTKIEGNKQL